MFKNTEGRNLIMKNLRDGWEKIYWNLRWGAIHSVETVKYKKYCKTILLGKIQNIWRKWIILPRILWDNTKKLRRKGLIAYFKTQSSFLLEN